MGMKGDGTLIAVKRLNLESDQVFKAHRLFYHSNLGLREIKKKRKKKVTRSHSLPACKLLANQLKSGLVFEAHRLLYHSA